MNSLTPYPLELLYSSNQQLLCKESLLVLNEGANELVGDATQFIVGAIAEYGLIATIGGAPAGPVVETLTDAMFAVESVSSTLGAVGNIAELFGELSALVSQILSLSLEGGFDSFYEQVKEIWMSLDKILPDSSTEKLEELVDKAKESLEKIISKFSDFVSDSVKLVIPDAIIGTVVGEGLQQLLQSLAENAYSLLTDLIGQLGQYQQIVTSPDYADEVFRTIFEEVVILLDEVQAKIEEDSEGFINIATKVATGQGGDILTAEIANQALKLFRNFLEEKQPIVMQLVNKITRIMFPAIFALLASYQILMKGEWKEENLTDEETVDNDGLGLEKLLSAGFFSTNGVLYEITGGIGVPQQTGYGKNYHTANPEPITWENLEGPEYFVTSTADGSTLAAVSLPGSNISTPTYQFADEASAMAWVRNTFEKFRRELMAQEV
jgi:hypothetical protein